MSKTLQTRVMLKTDTLANWQKVWATFIPLKGEKIIFQVPTGGTAETVDSVSLPQHISKTGDGVTTLQNLPWDSALAADVYDWAKAPSKPSYTLDEISGKKIFTVKGAGSDAVAFNGSADKTLNITAGTNIGVTASAGSIEIKNTYTLPSAGTTLGGVKTGGVATISNGQITKVSKATHADTADTATSATNAINANNANKTTGTLTLTAGSNTKTFNGSADVGFTITAADLGLSAVLKFIGTTTTALTDGATTSPITVKGASHTPTIGDVVLYSDKEFVWTSSAWEELGDASALTTAVNELKDADTNIKALKIQAGDGLSGGGALSTQPTLTHATPNGARAGTKGATTSYLQTITTDKFGHITGSTSGTLDLDVEGTTNGNVKLKLTNDGTPITLKGSGATTVEASGDTITIGSTNTTYGKFTTSTVGLTNASGNVNNIVFGDNTWHGATNNDYIILNCGTSALNI